MVSDQDIWNIVNESTSLEEAVNRLVSRAKENGGEDNVTVILAAVESEEVEPSEGNA